MITLINLLIMFFILLITLQIFLAYFNNNIIEGLTSNASNASDPSGNNIVSQVEENSQDIATLQEQFNSLNTEVQDISGNVATLQTQVNQIITTQQQYATQMAPSSPPQISGAVSSSN